MALTKSISEIISEDTSGLLNIHPSWTRVRLGDIASVLNGFPFESAFFSTDTGTPLIRIRDVSQGHTQSFYQGAFEEKFLVQRDELLIGMDGDFNVARWKGGPALLNQRVCKITPDNRLYHSSLLEFALPGYLSAINNATSSITVKHLSSRSVEDIELPLPPRNEQTRIVEKLEELLSEHDAGVAELKAAQHKLVQYRQSLLRVAVEGALTTNWRAARARAGELQGTGVDLLQRILTERRARWETKQLAKYAEQGKSAPKDWQDKYPEPVQPDATDLPTLPEGWTWASLDMLGDIASGVAKGTKRDSNVPVREVPYLRVANVQRGYLNLSEVKTIFATERDIAELQLMNGDVLFNEGGDRDKLGRGWVWRDEVNECIHQNHVFRMRPYLPEIKSELISHHGNTFGKLWFQNAGKQTTNLASINMTMLRAFPVPVAPADEQLEILKQIQVQLDSMSHQERATELSLKQAVAQRQNILRAAFAGQLVQQDPNDESASLLLARIRAERVERAKLPKPPRTKRSKETPTVIRELEQVLAEAGDWLPAQEAFRRCGVADGAQTDRIEALYAELRTLDKAGRLHVKAVTDKKGRKQHDLLKLASV